MGAREKERLKIYTDDKINSRTKTLLVLLIFTRKPLNISQTRVDSAPSSAFFFLLTMAKIYNLILPPFAFEGIYDKKRTKSK